MRLAGSRHSHLKARRTHPCAWRVGAWLFLALAFGCGGGTNAADPGTGGTGGEVGAGGVGGSGTPRQIAAVTIESDPLVGTRLGQRWTLSATALDGAGDLIPDVSFMWESSEDSIASVDAVGLVTALGAGRAEITATAGSLSDSVALTARSAVPSDAGEMFTAWFARSDDAPAAIVDGKLEVFGVYPDAAQPVTPWPHPDVERFQWSGDRLAILTDVVDGLGTLRVLDRHQEWVVLRLGDVRGFQLAGDRIAELGAGGSLRVKESPEAPWITVATDGVAHFQLEGDRIAALLDDGGLHAKDGIDDDWTVLAEAGVRSFVLHGDRIAVLFEEGDGELRVKDGIDASWTTLDTRVKKVALSGDRIAVLRKDGVFRVKEGIDGEWVLLRNSYVEDIELEGDRIAMLLEGGELRAKDEVDSDWTVLSTDVSLYVLQGDRIGIATRDGELWLKRGLEGPWTTVTLAGSVSQLLPIADVPVPPARTTATDYDGARAPCAGVGEHAWQCPTSYAEAQHACVEDGARCKASSELALPVPYYGRFCGADRPLASDWDWALGPDGGPMDAFDALCMHLDQTASWYPEVEDSPACIVRYGLTYARLTRDGALIEPGTATYEEIMAKMGNLAEAMASDDGYTANCSSEDLDAFIETTRAKH